MPDPKGPEGVRALPETPNLEHLKNEAKERLRSLRAADPAVKLATAQFQLAREYGFPSWRQLKVHVEEAAEGSFGVVLLNDDKTPMQFVVYILEHLFGLQREAATLFMLATHENGRAVAAVHDRKEAERLAEQVRALAKAEGHPLECLVEPEDKIASAGLVLLPNFEEPRGPEAPIWTPTPEMARIGQMVMAGTTALEVASVLQSMGVFDQPGPFGHVVPVDLTTARFAQFEPFQDRRIVALLVSYSEARGFRGQAIPGTDLYPGLEALPGLPLRTELDVETPSWVSY